jgi:hypothetical protein
VVVDAGSGTGVLAVMAALCGARKVYAIERSDFASAIPSVARDSGVAVEVVRADFGTVVLPEKATVLVTETFGHWALGEGMMPDLQACAATNLVAGALSPDAFRADPACPAASGAVRTTLRGASISPRCAAMIGRASIASVAERGRGAQAVGTLPVRTTEPFRELKAQSKSRRLVTPTADGIDLSGRTGSRPTGSGRSSRRRSRRARTIEAGPAPRIRDALVSIGDREVGSGYRKRAPVTGGSPDPARSSGQRSSANGNEALQGEGLI